MLSRLSSKERLRIFLGVFVLFFLTLLTRPFFTLFFLPVFLHPGLRSFIKRSLIHLQRHSAVLFFIGYAWIFQVYGGGASYDLAKDIAMHLRGALTYQELFWSWPEHAPHFSIYPMYQWLVGELTHLLGEVKATQMIRSILSMAFTFSFYYNGRLYLQQWTTRSPDPFRFKTNESLLILLLSFLLIFIFNGRIWMARPEMWMVTWGLWVLTLQSERSMFLWILGGLWLSSFYWLSPLWLTLVFFLQRPIRDRLFLLVLIPALSIAGWSVYTHGEWLTLLMSRDDSAGIWASFVPELQPLLWMIERPLWIFSFLIFLFMALFFFGYSPLRWTSFYGVQGFKTYIQHRSFQLFLWVLFLLSTNYVRSFLLVTPFLALLLFPFFCSHGYRRRSALPRWALFFIMLATLGLCIHQLQTYSEYSQPVRLSHLPAHSKIMTESSDLAYRIPLDNPHLLSSPSMAVSWIDPFIYPFHLYLDHFNTHSFNCAELQATGAHYLVERHLTLNHHDPLFTCLTLISSQGPIKTWQIQPLQTSFSVDHPHQN